MARMSSLLGQNGNRMMMKYRLQSKQRACGMRRENAREWARRNEKVSLRVQNSSSRQIDIECLASASYSSPPCAPKERRIFRNKYQAGEHTGLSARHSRRSLLLRQACSTKFSLNLATRQVKSTWTVRPVTSGAPARMLEWNGWGGWCRREAVGQAAAPSAAIGRASDGSQTDSLTMKGNDLTRMLS